LFLQYLQLVEWGRLTLFEAGSYSDLPYTALSNQSRLNQTVGVSCSPEWQEASHNAVGQSGTVPGYRRDLTGDVLSATWGIKVTSPVLAEDTTNDCERVAHCAVKQRSA